MGGDEILEFVSAEFSQRAQAAYDTLGVVDLNLENVWHVFCGLYPLVFLYTSDTTVLPNKFADILGIATNYTFSTGPKIEWWT